MNDYVNLSKVILYKTKSFNITDTILFSSVEERDNYFNSLPSSDILELTDFTDLYEGRNIVLPYNYLDLKRYNTMKLYYNDGLGHEETYYCNVDNYIYVSSEACVPIYRIDYFLTFGYLLYNKNINMITDRRTIAECNIKRNMKADSFSVPKIYYDKHKTYAQDASSSVTYIAFLNKTTSNIGKNGINCKFKIKKYGTEDVYDIDDYTIGCYIAFVNKENLSDLLNAEPQEYIEKIVECDVPVSFWGNFERVYQNNVAYVNSDVVIEFPYYISEKYNKLQEFTYGDIKNDIQNTHNKKIMNWLTCKGCVVQGYEYDFKDFEDEDFIYDLTDNLSANYHSGIYFYNVFGYTFAYPIGYKGEKINMDYMQKWQSAKNFSYSSNYTNSLAYREQLEYNNQATINAQKQANIQSYYASLLAQNANEQLDITKQQTEASYLAQLNSLNDTYNQTSLQGNQAINELNINNNPLFNVVGNITGLLTGSTYKRSALFNSQQITNKAILSSNLNALAGQKDILKLQRDLSFQNIENQKQANLINASYKSDTACLARDNAIANIAISNKYNNAKPNAYNQADFSQFTAYYYVFYIDTDNGKDLTIENNIKNHYNVYGVSLGYLENRKLNDYEGLYFDYVKGSVLDNNNMLYEEIDSSLYIELTTRIEQGLRLWHLDNIDFFGNVIIDNTYTGSSESILFQELTEERKQELKGYIDYYIYEDLLPSSEIVIRLNLRGLTSTELQYCYYLLNNIVFGIYIEEDKKTRIASQILITWEYEGKQDYITCLNIIKSWEFLTIIEQQYAISQLRTFEGGNSNE